MIKNRKHFVITSLVISSALMIGAGIAINSTPLTLAVASKSYDLILSPADQGLPTYTAQNEGNFCVFTSDKNPIYFRYKSFGVDNGVLRFDKNEGYLLNLTPIDNIKKITVPHASGNATQYSYCYGYYNSKTEWVPGYQIAGGSNYGSGERSISGLSNEFAPDSNHVANIFKIYQADAAYLKLKEIKITYICGE